MQTIDHLCAAVAFWLPLAIPACFFAWLSFRFNGDSVMRLLRVTTDFAATALIVTARAWYVKPDHARSPIAAVSSAAIMTIPTVVGVACVFLHSTRSKHPTSLRALYSLAIGYAILILSFFPAGLVFIDLGGDYL